MRQGLRQMATSGSGGRHGVGLALAAALLLAGFAGAAQAQAGKRGTYAGTVAVSGTETEKHGTVNYRATIKVSLPLTEGDERSARAEVDDVDKPSAMATITQWDVAKRNASPDSDGKITSWKCSLAKPTEVPMNGSGALNVDYRKKTHSMFVALVSTKQIPLDCVNSRSGPYKTQVAVGLFFGTNEPDVLPWKELPFADAARLAAKHVLVPVSNMKGRNAPQEQEWDLRLSR
jgi:hypothetical protein